MPKGAQQPQKVFFVLTLMEVATPFILLSIVRTSMKIYDFA